MSPATTAGKADPATLLEAARRLGVAGQTEALRNAGAGVVVGDLAALETDRRTTPSP